MPNLPNFFPVAKDGRGNIRVAKLKSMTGDGWSNQLIREVFEPGSANAILAIEWPKDRCVDKLVWLGNDGAGFSIGNIYKSLFGDVLGLVEMNKWTRLWKLKIHDRLELFLWWILARVIPTRDLMNIRFGLREVQCLS